MDKLAIPFAHESFSAFNLVEDERNDVEQQLDERRIAMQQIRDMGHAYGEGDIVIDVDNDTVNTTDGVIAQEANATLAVMVKAILRGVKDYGVANENIVEATISSNDNSCLLKEYACFYSNDGFKMILDALISIGNKVYQGDTETLIENVPSLQKIKELNENGIEENDAGLISGAPVDSNKYLVSIPILDYINNLKDLAENFVFLNRNAREIYRGTNTDATDPDAIDRGTLENWGTQTLSSLEARTSSKFVQLVIDLNKAFTRSLSDLYSQISTSIANYGDEELNESINAISEQYSILCSNSEFNLVSERTSALESYISNLMAIEAFRDSTVGKLLNIIYRIIKVVFKFLIASFASLAKLFIDGLIKLINGVNAKLSSFKIKEKTQKLKASNAVIYFNNDLSNPAFYVKYGDQVKGYDVSINGIASGISPNDTTKIPPSAKIVKIDSLKEVTKSYLESMGNNKFTVNGYILNNYNECGIITTRVLDFIENLRDTTVNFLRTGKTTPIEKDINTLKLFINNIVRSLQIPTSKESIKIETNALVATNLSEGDLDGIYNECIALKSVLNSFKGVITEVDDISSIFTGNIVCSASDLEILAKTFRVSSAKIDRISKGIDKVFSQVDDSEESERRVKVAKEYTTVVCELSKILTKAINNTVQISCKLQRFGCYSDLIIAKLINRIYVDVNTD